MTKIVYNNCYGGFSLSDAAIEYGRKASGDPTWGERVVSRTDSILVAMLEDMGSKLVSGHCAKLAIRELPPGTRYRIDEYDGCESVVTVDEYDWSVA